jgi:polyisoprenyl-teichoic acid--peptidoglycan teichoic acid transferase
VALISALVLVVLLVGIYLWMWSVFNRIERVEVSPALSSGGDGTNYLIVGSDSRDDLSENAATLTASQPMGSRADTIMVLHMGGDGAKIMSIPRDLYVSIADGGGNAKINAAYNDGPQRLTRTVSESLGIPINRYMEVDFSSFGSLVDGLGGVTVDFPHAAKDVNSGLLVTEPGPTELDGEQALAYVRSRNYTECVGGTYGRLEPPGFAECIGGQEVVDPTGDLGRVQRQQTFLTTVFSDLGDTRNPLSLSRSLSNASAGLRIDDAMSMWDAVRLAWNLRGLDPAPVELPATPGSNEAGFVFFLDEGAAQSVLEEFR